MHLLFRFSISCAPTNDTMYVEHFNHSDSGGGASIAAYRLVSALNSSTNPVSAKLRVIQSSSNETIILKPQNKTSVVCNKLARFCSAQISKLDSHSRSNPYSLSLWPSGIPYSLTKSSCDIVNLHWLQAESISIEDLQKISKPLVWTLHDTWPFCGATHYPDDLLDQRFASGYIPRKQPNLLFDFDLNYLTWRRKVKAWRQPMHLVCPSNWMKECANRSIIMRNWPATVIPNPLPVKVFAPRSKSICRRYHHLPADCFIISFSAHDLSDKRKGISLLIKLLQSIRRLHDNVVALVIGSHSTELARTLPVPSFFTGYLASEYAMANALNCADVHIVPSLIDNLPQTATEAQSCGIPTIAFTVGGLSDAIAHELTGYLVQPYDLSEMCQSLSALILNPDLRSNMSRASRRRALSLWSPDIVAFKYFELYANILSA